jgi:hypothetical protein
MQQRSLPFEVASQATVTTSAPASLSLLTLLKVVPFGPASHVSDDRLLALIHMYMLDADNLSATVRQTAERFELSRCTSVFRAHNSCIQKASTPRRSPARRAHSIGSRSR